MLLKKKLIAGVLALGISLTGATSAFAYDGWADSKQTAYQLQAPILGISTVLDKPYDIDWYTWTNNTGKSVLLRASLKSPDGLRYGFSLIRSNGSSLEAYGVTGGTTFAEVAPINPGETIYFQVRGHDFSQYSATAQYNFYLTYS